MSPPTDPPPLAAFLLARLDEYGPGQNPEVGSWSLESPTLRQIVQDWIAAEADRPGEEQYEYAQGIKDGRADAYRDVAMRLAVGWRHHPAYDPDWAP